ncbi:MAG: hypothetical protein WA876_05920 [Candidatus Acidiferrales bacterium]
MNPEDKFNINLNQNLWGVVVSYAALGVAEHWGLRCLRIFSLILAAGTTLSVLVALVPYTIRYWRDKMDN